MTSPEHLRPFRWRHSLGTAALVALLATGACASRGTTPSGARPPRQTGTASTSEPGRVQTAAARDTHENLHAVLWMQTSAEYRAALVGTYARARMLLDHALERPTATAALEQENQPLPTSTAVILDLDETVLDNSPYQGEQVRRRATSFDPRLWTQWVATSRAEALPGAIDFLTYARDRGVKAVFVTNRHAPTEKAATIENLRRLGLDANAENVLCEGERGWTRDKHVRRDFVAKRYRILLLIGDDLGDFVSAHGLSLEQRASMVEYYRQYWLDRWVVVPNPAYGSWEGALAVGAGNEGAVLERKRSLLRGLP